MIKSYEDGILDCLNVINKYKLVGIYDIPIKYIEEGILKLLPADSNLDQNDINAQS